MERQDNQPNEVLIPQHQPPRQYQSQRQNQGGTAIGDYTFPNMMGVHSPIAYPMVSANNFKPLILSLLQNNPFLGLSS